MAMIELKHGASKTFEMEFAEPKPNEIKDNMRFSLIHRSVPLLSDDPRGFTPKVNAAELLADLYCDMRTLSIAINSFNKETTDAETNQKGFLALRGYITGVYASWLSSELNAVVTCSQSTKSERIKVMIDADKNDYAYPGKLGFVGADFRKVEQGGASCKYLIMGDYFKKTLDDIGIKVPNASHVSVSIYGALHHAEVIEMQAVKIPPITAPTNQMTAKYIAFIKTKAFGAYLIRSIALKHLLHGIQDVGRSRPYQGLKVPPQSTLSPKSILGLKSEITASFADMSFSSRFHGFVAKAQDLYNPGTFKREEFETDQFDDLGIRWF